MPVKNRFKLDLHTHSEASKDGGLRKADYIEALKNGTLDFIAVTDHNRIDFALELKRSYVDKIIVGEEVSTTEGDIIGLFLIEPIEEGLSLKQSIDRIHKQGGLVYVPHPFETVRSGIGYDALNRHAEDIDIIEVFNGRAYFQNKSKKAKSWKVKNNKVAAASSDAHGKNGWGRTYTVVSSSPVKGNLVRILQDAHFVKSRVGFRGILYPKYNRFKKLFLK